MTLYFWGYRGFFYRGSSFGCSLNALSVLIEYRGFFYRGGSLGVVGDNFFSANYLIYVCFGHCRSFFGGNTLCLYSFGFGSCLSI